eukprot:Skav227534  [mRNA]  locus=scaffold3314:72055:81915:+ [translate_table: standard]
MSITCSAPKAVCWHVLADHVIRVTPIERHVQGIVCIKFKLSSEAEECIRVMDGRAFDGRYLEASFYDGKTDLKAFGVVQDALKKAEETPAPPDPPQPTPPLASKEPSDEQQTQEQKEVEAEREELHNLLEWSETEGIDKATAAPVVSLLMDIVEFVKRTA